MKLRILLLGDIVGSLGRKGVAAVLPKWKREHKPHLVIANVENLAHGSGVTKKTLAQVREAGVDVCTSGNHVWRKSEASELLTAPDSVLLRPANWPTEEGVGEKVLTVAKKNVLVVNLNGRVFFPEDLEDPFRTMDAILERHADEQIDAVVVDFHAEATSEKVAFAWYVDGRVSAVLGTHTHVPTRDAWVLPGGTAYQTDIGMVGPRDSVIGMKRDEVIHRFLHQYGSFTIMESGPVTVNGTLVTVDTTAHRATAIEPLNEQLTS